MGSGIVPFLPLDFEFLAEVPSPLVDLATRRGRDPCVSEVVEELAEGTLTGHVSLGRFCICVFSSVTFVLSCLHSGSCAHSLRHWEQLLLRKGDRFERSCLFEGRWLFLSFAIFCCAQVCPACVGIRHTDVVCKAWAICPSYVFRSDSKIFSRA